MKSLIKDKSNEEIIDFMTERYGDFVLYRPPFKANTLILWLAPVLALICGVAFFYSLKRRGENISPTLPDNERKKLEQLLKKKGLTHVSIWNLCHIFCAYCPVFLAHSAIFNAKTAF
jgi:cytochrome c-type biogenesis protein CcmH/NrfF